MRAAVWDNVPGSGVARTIYDLAREEVVREEKERIERLERDLDDARSTVRILLRVVEDQDAAIERLLDENAELRRRLGEASR